MNRDRFPGIAGGWARLDGPAGTQMVDSAIDAMTAFMRSGDNANHGGVFAAAHATDDCVEAAREAVARLLGAEPRGVAFGPSMTAMTMRLSAAVGRTLGPGDEVVVTRLDHDANVRPWVIAAERAGATVRWAEPDRDTLALPASAIEAVLSERTRWVAVTAASNASGTVPELDAIVAAAHAAGARISIDAVAAAPHRALSLAALGADTLACSAYKWYGPHIGILCAAPALLEELVPDKLAPSPDEAPDRFELGTLPFESLAGVTAAAGVPAGGRLRRDPRARGAAARDRRGGTRRDRRRDAVRRPARPRADADVQRRGPDLGRGRDGARRARDRGLGRQLLRARARALPRAGSATGRSAPGSSTTTTRRTPGGWSRPSRTWRRAPRSASPSRPPSRPPELRTAALTGSADCRGVLRAVPPMRCVAAAWRYAQQGRNTAPRHPPRSRQCAVRSSGRHDARAGHCMTTTALKTRAPPTSCSGAKDSPNATAANPTVTTGSSVERIEAALGPTRASPAKKRGSRRRC